MPGLDFTVNVDAEAAKAELDELHDKIETINKDLERMNELASGGLLVDGRKIGEVVKTEYQEGTGLVFEGEVESITTEKKDVQISPHPPNLGHPMCGHGIADLSEKDESEDESEDRWSNTLYNE